MTTPVNNIIISKGLHCLAFHPAKLYEVPGVLKFSSIEINANKKNRKKNQTCCSSEIKLKIEETFNSLMPGGSKRSHILKLTCS